MDSKIKPVILREVRRQPNAVEGPHDRFVQHESREFFLPVSVDVKQPKVCLLKTCRSLLAARSSKLAARSYNILMRITRHERPEDVPALALLVNRAFVAESPYIEGDRVNENSLREMLAKGSFILFEEDHEIIACTFIEPRGDRAHLGLISVDPTRQGHGLGSELMAAVEEHCRQAGYREMELRFINHRHELERFYARQGFAPTGITESITNHRVKRPFHFVQMIKPLG